MSLNRPIYQKHMLLYLSKFPALAVIDLCIRGYGLPRDRDAELSKIAGDLARRNPALCFVGLSLVDGRMKRDNDPVFTWFQCSPRRHG